MYEIRKRMEVAGSHCLRLDYESKCANVHGHNWIITVFCRAEEVNGSGMVIDFTDIKSEVHSRLDHQHLNDIIEQPTAENMARWICDRIDSCYRVDVQESEGNVASYIRDF